MTYSDLMARCSEILTSEGLLGLVAPASDEDSLNMAASLHGLEMQRICRVTTAAGKAPKRILCIFGRGGHALQQEELLLGSNEYKYLVSPFYIRIH